MGTADDSLWLRGAMTGRDLSVLDRLGDGPGQPGARIGTLDPALIHALAPVQALIAGHALPGARLVRVVWFSKTAEANWGVPWHQDRIIAVAGRHDVPGYSNWSGKSGIWHCEPPVAVMERMRFVRLHLDPADAENGAMQIARGSQREGYVPAAQAAEVAGRYPLDTCTADRGDVQILPMLVLHRSLPSVSGKPRRALRLDYAAVDLPRPLDWALEAA